MVVPVETEPSFTSGNPAVLFDLGPYRYDVGRNYALAPDGERFLMIKEVASEQTTPQLIIVQNWFQELERLVSTED